MKQLLLAFAVTVALSVMAACETRPEDAGAAPAAGAAEAGVRPETESP